MVNWRRLCLILAACCFASPGPARSLGLNIRSAVVLKAGQWRDDSHGEKTPADCAEFHLSAPRALTWLRTAKVVKKQTWNEVLDWSQCSASGMLVTVDGRRRAWNIENWGRGLIFISPTQTIYLSGRTLP